MTGETPVSNGPMVTGEDAASLFRDAERIVAERKGNFADLMSLTRTVYTLALIQEVGRGLDLELAVSGARRDLEITIEMLKEVGAR